MSLIALISKQEESKLGNKTIVRITKRHLPQHFNRLMFCRGSSASAFSLLEKES